MRFSSALTVLSLAAAFFGPLAARAATTPSLGAAAPYPVLASTYTNTSAGTTVNGSVGFTTPPAVVPAGTHANYGAGAPYATAGTDQGNALSSLAGQSCTFTFAPGAVDLSADATHGPVGVYAPGVYCVAGAMSVGGLLTLSGSGTYIFRSTGALTSAAGAIVSLSGANACNVFWTPDQATTLAANTTFQGTVIDDSGITIGANTTWTGRALSFAGTVTTDTDTLTAPTCTTAPPSSGSSNGQAAAGTVTVVKVVINDNGRTKTIADFPLFMNGIPVVSGETNTFFPAIAYDVTETPDPNYVRSFSGDCDANGRLSLNAGENKVCVVTNNDIGAPVAVPPVPPLIDVVKVPSPLALPNGPGPVTYTYTLRNVGTVPVSNIRMVGDTCSPIVRLSGDTNNDGKLDVNEAWTYRCSTTLTETHTNVIVATGTANGLSTTDIASATVVVGLPVVPPLIHVTKVPSRLALSNGGGAVTYTEKVTNPGTVPLSDVILTDDTCSPMSRISGDVNGNGLLESNETWTYTCRSNLSRTTTNTAIVTGWGNNLMARDFAVATVVVAAAVPALPKTGVTPPSAVAWAAVLACAVAAGGFLAVRRRANRE